MSAYISHIYVHIQIHTLVLTREIRIIREKWKQINKCNTRMPVCDFLVFVCIIYRFLLIELPFFGILLNRIKYEIDLKEKKRGKSN